MNEMDIVKFAPYEGEEPYIFVSYSHRDSALVIPLLNSLHAAGYRIWYDKGICGGDNWRESVGNHILDCSVCMPLLSERSLQSKICLDEIDYALAESRTKLLFPVRLEKVTMPPQLFQLHSLHYLRLYDYDDIDSFVNSLTQEPILQPCRRTTVDKSTISLQSIDWSIAGEIKWRIEKNGSLIISSASSRGRMQDFVWDTAFPFANTPWHNNRSSITSVVIEDGVTTIGSHAFLGCYNLKNVTIPDGVTYIGRSAFNGCTSLRGITLPGSVEEIGNYAFSRCANLMCIQVSPINKRFCSDAGVLFDRYKSELLYYPSGKDDVRYTIPNTVKRIGNSAFSRCDSLNYIDIPLSMICIDNYAFDGCSTLNEITIPISVTKIGKGAFRGCDNVRSVSIPASITRIDDYVFYFCKRLCSVVMPDSVTSIGDLAFCGCKDLRNITLSATVQYIEDGPWASFSPWTTIIRK